jgi:hydroxyacylglutathione hydrolase
LAAQPRPASLPTLCAIRGRDPDIHAVDILLPQILPQARAVLSPGTLVTASIPQFWNRLVIPSRFSSRSLRHFTANFAVKSFFTGTPHLELSSYNNSMIHEILPVGPLQCNCSVIGDESTREAIVIDPGDDIQDVFALIRKHNLQVKQIVITHAHIDHVGGAMKLRAATGAPVLLNQNDQALLKMLDVQAAWIGVPTPSKVEIDRSITTGETVSAGSLNATILHTPGHTEGSICLYFPAEKKLIAGDTLFAGSIGRTDLPGGSMQKILRSLHDTVLTLPDETVVVPGHGPLTTIGEERETNPFLVKR